MHDTFPFLEALALVLCVAAVTTVLFQKLRQPVVLGYILAGLLVGPYIPVPLSADTHIVETLSELGVILLMFSLGLEFNLKQLLKLGPTAGLTAIVQCSLMLWMGFSVGQLFGWTTLESLFTGAIIATSSTTIIAKAFDEQQIRGRWRELVVGILIIEDLIAIVLMAALTAVASGSGLSAPALAITAGRLLLFLTLLMVIGLLTIPRAMRYVVKLNRSETTIVASIGLCFAIALLARSAGYSVALGAFLAGSLVAESGEARTIEHLIQPVRDMFAAVFFVSVGMLIDPKVIVTHWGAVVVLTIVVVVGKIGSVTVGAFLTGNSTRRSVQAGMSLAQIGEFSFIIAGLGLSLGATRNFLYPVAVAISAVTTLLTPWLIRGADPVAQLVDRKLPKPLQTFTTLYATWFEQLRQAKRGHEATSLLRRLVRLLLIDAGLLAGILLGAALSSRYILAWAAERMGASPLVTKVALVVAVLAAAAPFLLGLFRTSGKLGLLLAELALPRPGERKFDLGDAPRRAFVVTIQLALVLLVAIPLLAVTQPLVPNVPLLLLLLPLAAILAWAFWRSATNLQGHVRAGIHVIVEVLSKQSHGSESQETEALAGVTNLLPGLGDLRSVVLREDNYASGRSLAELNLRGTTGATVLACSRKDHEMTIPDARELLQAGDVLALAGTHEALAAAEHLLKEGPERSHLPAA